ncbi:MAG: cell division protein FtsH [Chloroflexi bacterium RBG_16_50_9]|nr:MAG: cell division protein FtsH [Chloroflexi bacterium RBG_16_50_9]
MCKAQQVAGPVVPVQYGAMQISGPSACYPTQTSGPTDGMFSTMMPMVMMIMMMAITMPMVKGVAGSSES